MSGINGNSPLQPRKQLYTEKQLNDYVKDPGLFQNQKTENSQNNAAYNKLLEQYGITPENADSYFDNTEFDASKTEEDIPDGSQGKNYAELAAEFGSAAEEITVNNSDFQNFKNELLSMPRDNAPAELPQEIKTAQAEPAPVQNQPEPPQAGKTETQKDSAGDIDAQIAALRAQQEPKGGAKTEGLTDNELQMVKTEQEIARTGMIPNGAEVQTAQTTDAGVFLDNEAKLEGSGNSVAATDKLIKNSGIIDQIKAQAEEIAQKNGISKKDAMNQIINARLGEVQKDILDAVNGTDGAKNFDSKDTLDISNLKVSCSKCGRHKDKHKKQNGKMNTPRDEGAHEMYQIGHKDLHTEKGDRKMDKLHQANPTGRSFDSDPILLEYFNQNETQRQLGIIHQLQEEMDKM